MVLAQIISSLKKNYWCASTEIKRVAVERMFRIDKTYILYCTLFRWDGSEFKLEANQSSYGHSYTMLGNYKGSPFIVGDSILQHNRLEIMNLETRTWEEFESYPYTREWVVHNFSAAKYILNYFSIYLYATASYDDSVFIFGGYSQYDGRIQSTIAKYDGQWSKVGDLGSVSRYESM